MKEGRRIPGGSAGIRQATLFGARSSPAGGTGTGSRAPEAFLDAPLAHRMRPRTLDEVVGQPVVSDPSSPLRRALRTGGFPSLILWGPPGSGKTTLAYLLADTPESRLVSLSAVTSGVAEVRRTVEEAEAFRAQGIRTVLFIDEIHRFSRAQQDSILPHVETGRIRLVGATTENPSFAVTAALLSRCQVVKLDSLPSDALRTIIARAVSDTERGLGKRQVEITEEGMVALIGLSQGDARSALGALETAEAATTPDPEGRRRIDGEAVRLAFLSPRALYHDREGDLHYDTVSALVKSVRGSDPDAAVYWLARLLEAGEDPMFIARRLVLSAAEDIGLADPQGLTVAVGAMQAVHGIGMPEGYLPLAEATLYLAMASKSNSGLKAYEAAREAVRSDPTLPVPLHLRNASTGLMRDLGYGAGYRYAHDAPGHVVAQSYLPEALVGQTFYVPGDLGVEGTWGERLEGLRGTLRGEHAPTGSGKGEGGQA